MSDWTDRLAGARMQVDQQFQDRVTNSQFSNQQWGLIMTAVDWEIRDPADPEAAELVADTTHLPDIVPELDRVQQRVGGAAAPPSESSGGGIAGSIKKLFGSLSSGGSGGDQAAQQQAAEALVQDYANELQRYLEKRGRWAEIRELAAGGDDPSE